MEGGRVLLCRCSGVSAQHCDYVHDVGLCAQRTIHKGTDSTLVGSHFNFRHRGFDKGLVNKG
jgi:hypothetical protein